jgi:hypothetical protein
MVLTYYDTKNTTSIKLITLSLLWALGLLLKPVLLPTIVLSPLLFLYFSTRKKQRGSVSLLLPLLIFILGGAINYINTKNFEYSSISTINLGQYNAKLTIAKAYGFDSAQSYVSKSEFATPRSSTQYSDYKTGVKALAISTIIDNLAAYTAVHIAGSLKMLVDPGRFELYTFFNEPTADSSLTEMIYAQRWNEIKSILTQRPLLFILFVSLFAIALLKLLIAAFSLARIKKLTFILLITAYFVAIAGPVGAARFMLPVSVIYLILVCEGADFALHFFQKSTKGK